MPIDERFLEHLKSKHPDEDRRPEEDRFCRECDYPLRGLPRNVRCPECGAPELPPPEQARDVAAPGQHEREKKKAKPPRCRGCGYLLAGLPSAGRCPECGAPYRPRERQYLDPSLVPDEVLESVVWRTGLFLMAAGTLVGLFMQMAVLVSGITGREYTMTMFCASIAWALGLVLASPATLDGGAPMLKVVRRSILASQWLWPMAFLVTWLLLGDQFGTAGGVIYAAAFAAFLLAGLGMIGALSLLAATAKDLYMRRCAAQFIFAAFLFPVFAIGVWIAPYPAYVTVGIPLSPYGGLHALILVVFLGPWWAIFLLVLISLLQLTDRARWAIRIKQLEATRSERVRSKREAMNASIGVETVGPTVEPPAAPAWLDSGDIPLEGAGPVDRDGD